MPLPTFTAEEQYLLSSIRMSRRRPFNYYTWAYITACLVMCGFAVHEDNIELMAFVFVALCGFRLYEERSQHKWWPVWNSVIDKYEAALQSQSPGSIPSA